MSRSVIVLAASAAMRGRNHGANSASPAQNFAWSTPSGGTTPTGYRLYWGTITGSHPSGPHEDASVDLVESYSALGLAADTTYYVVARAYNGAGEGAKSNEIQVRNGVQVGP